MEKFRGSVVDVMSEPKVNTIMLNYENQISKVPVTITAILLIAIAQDKRLKIAKTLTGCDCTSVTLPEKIIVPGTADNTYREAMLNIAIHMGYTGDYYISPFTLLKIGDKPMNSIGSVLKEQIPAFGRLCSMLDVNPDFVYFTNTAEQVDRVIQECFSYTIMSKAPDKIKKNLYYDPDQQEESGSDKEIIPKFNI